MKWLKQNRQDRAKSEYGMPDPPKGYEWVVYTRDADGAKSIWVDLQDTRGLGALCRDAATVSSFEDEEFNAKVAIHLAQKLLDLFNSPSPPPPPAPSFNGLTGYRRGWD